MLVVSPDLRVALVLLKLNNNGSPGASSGGPVVRWSSRSQSFGDPSVPSTKRTYSGTFGLQVAVDPCAVSGAIPPSSAVSPHSFVSLLLLLLLLHLLCVSLLHLGFRPQLATHNELLQQPSARLTLLAL